nr:MAG TPA: NUDIX domain protein [Caudoviricetes sp.]
MSQNVRNVRKRAKCPDCPKMMWYYHNAGIGQRPTALAYITIYPAGSIARL